MKLKLESGVTGFTDENGNFVATGSQMGYRDTLPEDPLAPCRLNLKRLKWVDGDYLESGVYYGGGSGDHIYCAWDSKSPTRVFVRAVTREQAKELVAEILPAAKIR